MRTCRRRLLLLAGLVACAPPLAADEGMWMPQQIPALAQKLRALGFEGDPSAFADLTGQPMGAIVSLGGCTASFASPEGLIVTNHHCVQGSLQYNSTPQRNLLVDGYLAKTREEELSNGPGSRVLVTVSVKEVTEAVTGRIDPRLDDLRRFDFVERRAKERVAACEAGGLRCRVDAFFGGLKYFETAQVEIQDVRLVYAPPQGIGNFGGETDNWRWPRHTGDFSFYRAYVGRDGKPAPFSKDNVPFRPAHWLRVQPAGVREGDLVFVVGYPGRTQRHQTYAEVKETTEWAFPRFVRGAEEQIALLEALGKTDPELKIKAAARLRGLNNALTNRKGQIEGLVKGGILARKEEGERALAAWIAGDPGRRKEYGGVLPALAAQQAEAERTRERDAVFASLLASSSMLSAAHSAHLLSVERAKKDDLDREPEFQERNWARVREGQQRAQRTIDARIDRALLAWAMARAAALPAGQRISGLDKLVGLTPGMTKADSDQAIADSLQRLFAGTRMTDEAFRIGLLGKTTAEIAATRDPMVDLALALDPLYLETREAAKRRQGASIRLRPLYMRAILAQSGGLVAPDANGTLRVTFGVVKGKPGPDGTVWTAFTSLKGIEQKATGDGEFNAPARQLEAIRALRAGKATPHVLPAIGDVPVDFLSTVDTTGGNSGSPTLDGKGDLVGLLFDGTYDTIASDFLFDPVNTRSIHVDVRDMLWTMAEVDGASHLLREMGVGQDESGGLSLRP
ncbi:MAG TPA: S46 family peptidase [Vicinamibacteria bacterium]|nr:S46 family peptidase [Vicinamibacteria bacterium]